MSESTTEFRVRYAETDQMGVVYHTNYLVWCEIGRTDLMRELGATYAELERRGVFLTVSEARIRFLASARYDDRIRVRTRLTRLRSRGVRFSYVIEDADSDRALARAETDLICLNAGGVPRKLPDEVVQTLNRVTESAAADGTIDALTGVDTVAGD